MARNFIGSLAALAMATAVATSPAMAQVKLKKIKSATTISAAEKKQGVDAHPQLVAEFGGAYAVGPQAAYVTRVGQTIAVQSGMSNAKSDFTITLLNSPINNAFAIPGGYVYVTRQLLGLMNNEAELAGVLGHEVGHVAARHSKKRQSAATRNTIIGVLGTVLGNVIGDGGGLGGLLGGGLQNYSMQLAQIATLGFSRGQELEADQLGVQYLVQAGYDPAALSTMLASLANQTSLDAKVAGRDGQAQPEWASTHPDPASRVTRAAAIGQQLRKGNGVLNVDGFLQALKGVLYGDDPKEGVIEGRDFLHPDLRLGFTVPTGFGMQNGATAVSISGSGGQAQFSLAPYDGNMDAYIAAVFAKLGNEQTKITPGAVQRSTINGIAAAYANARVAGQSGEIEVTVFVYEFAKDRAYHFVTLAKAGGTSVFDPMFGSVRRLTDTEAKSVRPRKLDIITVGKNDTVATLSERMAYSNFQTDRFLVLNGLSANAVLKPGQRVKLVVYGTR